MTIGQRIAQKRNELGLSQAALGEELNVSRQSVSKWEADAAIPEIDKLITLSKRFGVTVGWLLGVEEDAAEAPPREPDWQTVLEHIQPPKHETPKWQKLLLAAMSVITVVALILSCLALWRAEEYRASADQIKSMISAAASEAEILSSFEYEYAPNNTLDGARFAFKGTPFLWSGEDTTARLAVMLDGKEVLTVDCDQGSNFWYASFELPAANGYTAVFYQTDSEGVEWHQQVDNGRLSSLGSDLQWRGFSYDLQDVTFENGTMTIGRFDFEGKLPNAFKDVAYPWDTFDLVLYVNGTEAGRIDLLNRSAYSKKGNFGDYAVDLTTVDQHFGGLELAEGDEIRLAVEYRFGGVLTGDYDFHGFWTWRELWSAPLEGSATAAQWTFVDGKFR